MSTTSPTIGASRAAAKKPHVSATQLDMYWRCPEQYNRRYIQGERVPPGIAAVLGSGVHGGIETNFQQKIESHEDLPTPDIVDAAVAAFEARVAGDGFSMTPEEADRGVKVVAGEAKDKTAELAGVYAKEQAPHYQPAEVEHTSRIVFPNATHDLLAVTDLRDDLKRVTDFKTSARKKPANAAEVSTQLTIYSAAYQVDRGEPPSELRLDVLTKAKTPARQVLTTSRTRADLQALANRVNATLDAIAAGNFTPASPDAWCCSPRWCGYWNTCRFVNSERKENGK